MAGIPGRQHLEGAIPFSLFPESRVSFSLPLHLFTLCKVDSRRDSLSASSQDFHFSPAGLPR
jgi:hypothetical protein